MGHEQKAGLKMRDMLLIAFHLMCCLQFSFAVYYDYFYTNVPSTVTKMHNAYGGKFKFLTFWDAVCIKSYMYMYL